MSQRPRINKVIDLAERVGWTFIQAYIGLGAIDWISQGINLSLLHELYVALGAATAATIKVLIGQRIGKSSDGAIPSPLELPPEN